jgi:hypothetical protein
MATQHKHYIEAERLLAEAQAEMGKGSLLKGPDPVSRKIAIAHVHALLATAPDSAANPLQEQEPVLDFLPGADV